jgi:glucokinase
MDSAGPKLLLADIGGTHARFMLAPREGPLPPAVDLATAAYPTLAAALSHFLGGAPERLSLAGAAIAAAGPVLDGKVTFTNCPWSISVEALKRAIAVAAPVLVNDFAAMAMGVTTLGDGDSIVLGPDRAPARDQPIGVLGPGTGLGVAALIPDGLGDYVAVAGEGGHVDLAGSDAREDAVLALLRERFDHVSAERVLSGPGLEHLYAALCARDGIEPALRPAADIAQDAQKGEPRACETVEFFTGWLGAVAGNLALTIGALGGVYLAGGILPRWGKLFDATLFRARFEAKGRSSAMLARIPTRLVTAPDCAFRGLRKLALRGRA